ncbi:hypothetical protein QMK17_04900 [Rhodococcus sp. G-MC3]|uniref:hypothetical protein n=1 Tax=Rhodococcus sp. G-MC3 TaxID=3046209 RepID=UPI0024BB34B4|nr:hypothetical protein [Rhodococcus sp. G-MC3]MDJ0392664.1 hypothetical protein [Rhodococcus sp. G-MC3]
MTTPQPNPLLTELRGPRGVLEKLTADESQHLLDLLLRSKEVEKRRLDAAIDVGLGVLPRLLRIPAKKILFGK